MPRSTRKIGLGELRVGLLVLIATGVLIVLILNASGNLNPFASHLHLRARFADANGLREGSEVRLAGVRIGKVDQIKLMTPTEVGNAPSGQNRPRAEPRLTTATNMAAVRATDRIRTHCPGQQA